jgi:NAD(P)H dehydrogenase (quinone)
MTSMPLIAVTGATGGVGSRVAARLADLAAPLRLVVRDAARAPKLAGADVAEASGYADRDAMTAALRGAHTLFLVSGSESADRVEEHRSALAAAVDAGVQRVVYTSFVGAHPDATFTFAQDHFHTEQAIRESGLAYTFLRDSMYLDFLPDLATSDGVIAGPAGHGRLAAVARDDVADAAVAVLTGDEHDGQTYELTGPEALTLAEVAEQLSEAAGRQVEFRNETLSEAYASRAHHGAPDFEIDGWVTSYAAIATGEMDVATDAVPQLTGHPALSLREYLAAHPESVDHLRTASA